MEKISSSNANISNGVSQLLDLSKNMSVKVDIKGSGNSFKDYVKVNNKDDNNKYDTGKDNKADRNNFKDKVNDKDVKEPSYKKENKDVRDTKTDKEVKSTDNKQESNRADDKKTEKTATDNKNVKNTEDKNLENVDKKQEVSKEAVENTMAVLNTIINNQQEPQEIVDVLEDITPQKADEVIQQIQEQEDIPQELKDKITDILKDVSQGKKIDLQKVTNLVKPENEIVLNDLKELVDNKNLFKEIVKQSKEDINVSAQINLENAPRVSLNHELNNLKNELNFAQNSNKQEQNVELIEEELDTNQNINSIFNADGTSNVKIFGMNTKIFTNAPRAAMNQEQIQNFSKIIDEMRLAFKDDKTTLNIKLQPESLGKLSIKINSENGVFNASFYVESDKAKQAIENQLHILRQSLLEQGINIQDINVQVGQNNEDLNYHQNIMEAINFSKKGGLKLSVDEENFEDVINPYTVSDDLFNDLI